MALVPLAHPSVKFVNYANQISKACTTVTFLVQVIIIGHDVMQKMRMKRFWLLTKLTELLTGVYLLLAAVNIVELAMPGAVNLTHVDPVEYAVQNLALLCIFSSRFYFLALSRGFRAMLITKKAEIGLYFLFLTHKYSFMLLNWKTNLGWDDVEATWFRLTVMTYIPFTLHQKRKSSGRGDTGGARTTSDKSVAITSNELQEASTASSP